MSSGKNGLKAVTMNGARGKVVLDGNNIGLFSDSSVNFDLGMQDIHTLGKYEAQEIVPVSHETVKVNCRGFRIMPTTGPTQVSDSDTQTSPYGAIRMASVADLLNHQDFTIQFLDRQNSDKVVWSVVRCRPTSLSQEVSAKGVMTFSISFIGIKLNDHLVGNDANNDTTSVAYPAGS